MVIAVHAEVIERLMKIEVASESQERRLAEGVN